MDTILRKNQADETYEVEYIITDTNLNFIKNQEQKAIDYILQQKR